MLLHSVVGKLWITIIVLVSAIFLFLSIILIEYFDHYYYLEQSNGLNKIGGKITAILEQSDDIELAIATAEEIVSIFEADMIITKRDEVGQFSSADSLFTPEQLESIYNNRGNVTRLNDQSYKDFITFNSANDILALAIPFSDRTNSDDGVLILYQTLENLYQTTNDIKKIVLIFAGIGILMTTVFTFFLSTKITAPLRQIQKAALQMAKGDFHNKVNIKSSDEIGDLAVSFNQMASQLDETVKALSGEKEKLSNILKSMADGVMTINTKGEIIIANPPAKNILHSWSEKGDNLPDSLKDMAEDVFKESKILEKDLQLAGRTFSVKMTPLLFGNEINGAVTLFRDITYERKLNKMRKDFLANVSHELRTPISMLQGYSEAIIDDVAETPEEKKDLAQIIYDESLRMGRLVNELLDLVKMESGSFQLQYCKINIQTLVNKMIRKFSSLAQELDINLLIDVDPVDNEVFVDADRIEQVLTNLIDNAIRHTPKSGKIILRAKMKENNKLLLEVEDSGVGIPEADLPFVFERFYKADKARTRGQSGTGLGLSIVNNIVQAHEGSISVTSKTGQGTTFSIILPVNSLPK